LPQEAVAVVVLYMEFQLVYQLLAAAVVVA
jgi:hypothetical protein